MIRSHMSEEAEQLRLAADAVRVSQDYSHHGREIDSETLPVVRENDIIEKNGKGST